jgi:LuxR family maltose regulon positive regulatory protein
MLANLLQTKFYIPSKRPSLIPRPHLLQKLDAGSDCKLILISAPAGYGKTSIVTEWIEHIQTKTNRPRSENSVGDICWLSLDEDDSHPQQFFRYLAAAIRPFSNIQSSLIEQLQSPQPLPTKNLMAAFVNDVTTIPASFYLVLDDYHTLESAEIDKAMAFLLEHMPPQMTLVITSRSDPGFPISRLRARGELIELRANDLRFTETEAAQFLKQSMNLTLSSEQIAALEKRTEGWIAGLQMAALSLQNRDDVTHFIDGFTGSHRFIMDYLLEEVLNQQPPEVKAFLMETAVLDHLCADLCDAVRQSPPPSQQILEQLETHNLFLIPLDNERRWYRYHHLFADLLQQRLPPLSSPSKGGKEGGHLRASQWYEANGLEQKAIHHAFAANDFEHAARLIELVWPKMDGSFQTDTWLEWAKMLPATVTRTRPVFSVSYAWALLNKGKLEGAEARLQDAERWLDAETDVSEMVVIDEARFRTLPGSIASARTYHAQALGDNANTIKYARQALRLLPEDDYIGRGPAASILGLMSWAAGDLEAAYQALAEAMNGFELAGQITFAISGTYGLADIRIAQGRLRDAIQIYERSLQLALAQEGASIRGTTDIYWGLGMLHHEQGEIEIAKQYLSKSEELGDQMALPDWPHRSRRALAHIKAVQGNFKDAHILLDEAEQLYFRGPVPDFRPIAALKAQLWIQQGKLTEAWKWVRARGLSVTNDLSYLREFEHLTYVRLLIAEYKINQTESAVSEAVECLQRLLAAAADEQRMGSVLEILVMQALAHEAQGDILSACKPLERALTLAEPEGYVRLFVDEGVPMAQLLSTIAAKKIMSDYVGKLLGAFDIEGQAGTSKADSSTGRQPLVDPLSERELEILTHVAAGMKNKEIAAQLFVSVNTIHYHTKNIYSKLGVNSRTKAIAKAKALNMLE